MQGRSRGRSGRMLVLVGPDGVGKTTVARALLAAYPGPTAYVHFRPSPRTPLPSAPPDVERPPDTKQPDPGSPWAGWLRLARSLALFWAGYLTRIRPALRRGSLVVADRWGYGYVGQPGALRFAGPPALARLFARLLPQPDLVVCLEAPVPVIRARKAELSPEEIEGELARWGSLPVRELLTIGAEASPEEIAQRIWAAAARVGRYKGFPPGGPLVAIPEGPRGVAEASLALYAPCRPRALALTRLVAEWERAAGWRLLPLRRGEALRQPAPEVWSELTGRWIDVAGPFDRVAHSIRRQASRSGMALLLLSGRLPVAFVKLRENGEQALDREAEALGLLSAFGPTSFRWPRFLERGQVGGWEYLLTEAMPPGIHRMVESPPLAEIVDEVSRALVGLSGEERPAHWRPSHGDLAPWNLRWVPAGGLYLIDWEDAVWAPPGADAAYYLAGAAALGGREPVAATEEVVTYWLVRLRSRLEAARLAGDRDTGLLEAMVGAFETGR